MGTRKHCTGCVLDLSMVEHLRVYQGNVRRPMTLEVKFCTWPEVEPYVLDN